jgi:hypothetical protein
MTDDEKLRAEISAQVFDGQPAAPAPEADKPELKPEAPAAEEKPVEQDEWAGLTPTLRAKFEQMQSGLADIGTVKERLQQAERRVGALTNELRDAKKKPEPPPEEEPEVVPESHKQFQSDYPEIAKPFEERVAAMRADILKRMPQIDKEALTAEVREQVRAEITRELAVERLEEAHSGWQQLIETTEFKDWHKTADGVPKVATNFADAKKLLDGFQAFRKTRKSPAEIEAARRERLEESQTVEGKRLPTPKSQADMSPAELRASIAKEVFG